MSNLNLEAPVIVGGVGGSGTRLISALLTELNIYMGSYTNHSADALFFAKLISHDPSLWKSSAADLKLRLETFTHLHVGLYPKPREIACMLTHLPYPKLINTLRLIYHARKTRISDRTHRHWGFKDPRTQFFLDQLTTHFPACKYIHVIRNGLDMAFSSNTNQIRNWGSEFGIQSENDRYTPSQILDFWITINTCTIEHCKHLLPGRYLLLNYDTLCLSPLEEISRLRHFLNIENTDASKLLSHIFVPASMGRYKARLSEFRSEQIQAVRDFGFDVD